MIDRSVGCLEEGQRLLLLLSTTTEYYCVYCCVYCTLTVSNPHIGSNLVLDEALQSVQFGLLPWVVDHTVQRSQRVQPDRTHISHLIG